MRICPTCQRTYSDDVEFCPRDGTRLASQAADADARLAAGLARHFRLVRRLGAGGMGTVFLAEQIGVGNRPVALKVLSRKLLDDPEFLLRFQNEAGSTGRIHHSNVVTIHESGQADDGTPYIAMEFLEGESLHHALLRRGALPVAEVAEILMQVARGLNAAHKLGIIHRDLKPDNIFLTRGDENELIVKIVDFGIAKLRESTTHTETGLILGTPPYMSYEQASGMRSDDLDARSDIYSLGIVVYEMLAGRVPFQSDTPIGYLHKHKTEEPPPFHAIVTGLSIPAEVEAAVMKALIKDRNKRYATALEFGLEFKRATLTSAQAEVKPLRLTDVIDPRDRERVEKKRQAEAQAEAERLEKEKAAAELVAREKAEQERIARENEEAERLVREKAERERLAREKAEADRIEKEKAAAEQAARQKAEQERLLSEKAEAERLEKEKAERERLAQEKAESERREKEKAAAEAAARKKTEQERVAREKAEAERLEKEKAAAAKALREKSAGRTRTEPSSLTNLMIIAFWGIVLAAIYIGVSYWRHKGLNPNGSIKSGSVDWAATAGGSAGESRVNPNDGLKYIWVPPGTFMMGCSPGDNGCEEIEKPQHQVSITRGFWMGQTEVPVGAYKRFAGAIGRKMPAEPIFLSQALNPGWGDEALSMVNVTWDDARDYCTWAGSQLPSEAQWEYAARSLSLPVGGEQWVNDWFSPTYYHQSPAQDPPGPTSGRGRVLRDGAWARPIPGKRVSTRDWSDYNRREPYRGFRCVGVVPGT